MVEDRITDGRRIAELLASEVDGRTDGELWRFAVTDPNRDVKPANTGARAYNVSRDGDCVGSVYVHDDYVRFELNFAFDFDQLHTSDVDRFLVSDGEPKSDGEPECDGEPESTPGVRKPDAETGDERSRTTGDVERAETDSSEYRDLTVRSPTNSDSRLVITVASGAAVKRATDVVQAVSRAVGS